MKFAFGISLLLAIGLVQQITGHARVADPPQRGSLWRHSEYDWANPGRQPDDNENFCGGRGVTGPYIGGCGPCGDSLLEPRPRKHEIGGEFERGIIVRDYSAGQTIPVTVDIAAGHEGWFEFKLCPYSETGEETEDCFDAYPLRFADGSSRYGVQGRYGNVNVQLVLPAGVTCSRCVLQWNWFGEGSDQYYKNCVDIAIR